MPVPFWDDAPDPWDVLVLGPHRVPGITKISGPVGRKIDVRSPPGGDGARVRDRGYEPARLEAEVRIWTAEQLSDLEALLAAIHPRRIAPGASASALAAAEQRLRDLQVALGLDPNLGNQELFTAQLSAAQRRRDALQRSAAQQRTSPRTPYDAAHPQLSLLGIRKVYVTNVTTPELERGVMTTRISMLEWTEVPRPAPRPSNTSRGLDGITDSFSQHRRAQQPTATPPARLR